ILALCSALSVFLRASSPAHCCSRHLSAASCLSFFFFYVAATTAIYTLSLHDALPISFLGIPFGVVSAVRRNHWIDHVVRGVSLRSEEHTSELQSHLNLVCRLLLEKKTRLSAAI